MFFQEVKEGCFANNHVSQVLVGDVPFQAFIIMKYDLSIFPISPSPSIYT